MHVACLVWYVEYSTRFFLSPASHGDSFSPSVFLLFPQLWISLLLERLYLFFKRRNEINE